VPQDLPNPRGHDVNLRAAPQLREYEAIADRIAGDRPGRVLDWGCGFGQMTDLLRSRGVDTVPFNYDPDYDGRRPLERFPEIEAVYSSEPSRLPFADGEFDAVLSCGVLEHVEFPDRSLAELRRVLRPNGTLYVYKLPNRASYLERIARRAGLYYHGMYPHDRLYDLEGACALVSANGFRVRESRMANMLPLTITGPAGERLAGLVWGLNRLLARLPLLNRFATNVEVVAARGG
jgi:SAM-dependent methyltransferase